MKVISIKQPWASLIVYGFKKYEFRSWNAKYRGELLIHASKTFDKNQIEKFKNYNIPFETGKIIGKVIMEESVPVTEKLLKKLKQEEKMVYNNMTPTGYGWKVSNPILIKPIEINGKLSFWDYDI